MIIDEERIGIYMFSVKPCIGGIKVIIENKKNIAWIDLYGDLKFADHITPETKKSVIQYLDSNAIEYSTDL